MVVPGAIVAVPGGTWPAFLAASMQAFTLLELTTFTPGMANWFSSPCANRVDMGTVKRVTHEEVPGVPLNPCVAFMSCQGA